MEQQICYTNKEESEKSDTQAKCFVICRENAVTQDKCFVHENASH